ncbi:hypothetical protein MMC30_002405 [Trapelia coarctata]|nr:hypothetical protein [Trapelia coarctata]
MPRDQRDGWQSLVLKSVANKVERPRGIKRKQSLNPVRKSARLQDIQRLRWQSASKDKSLEQIHLPPSPFVSNSYSGELPQDSPALEKASDPDRKRKRSQETKSPTPRIQGEHPEKRARTSIASCAVEDKKAARSDIETKIGHPINYWIQEGSWPKEYFTRYCMDLLPRRKKSFASLQEENSETNMNTSCAGGDGTQAARNPEYEKQLTVAGIYLEENVATISKDDKNLCRSFLDANQPVPKISIFQDSLFETTASRYLHRSEAMIFRDINPLITPSAELLHAFGSTHLAHLREEINTVWTKCICLASGPRPKPDFVVGLKSSAFTEIELKKLTPYVGGSNETCFVKVTNDIFFPFLTCEAKCGEVGLTVADRQNAHSASIAVNAIAQLYKTVSREKEIDKKILAFSISHDNETVRIYGHYAMMDGAKFTFHRHPVKKFDFTSEEGKDKWTAYKFTKNLYDTFFPIHLARVKSAVIQLPDPKTFLVNSFPSVASADESEPPESQEMATSAPASQDIVKYKKPRLTATAMLKEQFDRLKEEYDGLKEQNKELMNMLKQRII